MQEMARHPSTEICADSAALADRITTICLPSNGRERKQRAAGAASAWRRVSRHGAHALPPKQGALPKQGCKANSGRSYWVATKYPDAKPVREPEFALTAVCATRTTVCPASAYSLTLVSQEKK
jgi:hypothetical protein